MYSDFVVNEIMPVDKFEEVPHPDGKGLVLVQRADGMNFTVDPWGSPSWSTDKGSWQRWNPEGGVLVAFREDTGREFFISRMKQQPFQS
jgi:hypothetical protein